MENLSASLASLVKVPPKVTPGRAVFVAPVVLRIPSGAVILGSNVSNWLGPPCMNNRMTDLSWTPPGVALAAAWASISHGSDSPPNPRAPIFRKSRRPQLVLSPIESMLIPPCSVAGQGARQPDLMPRLLQEGHRFQRLAM